MITIGRVLLVVSGALAFATASCGKKQNPEHAQLCRSYCAFVAAEQKDERKAEQTAQGAAQAAGIFNASSDEEAKRMGELARHDCIEMREQLSSARAHRRAIERARAIVTSRESSSADSDEPLPDCLTVSPAQMRAFAEKEAKVTPSPAPDDDARCQASCEQDLDQKLATIH